MKSFIIVIFTFILSTTLLKSQTFNIEKEWSKFFGTSNLDQCTGIKKSLDGSAIIIGYTPAAAHETFKGGRDFYSVKLSSSGETELEHCFGGYNQENAYDIAVLKDGNFVAGGYRYVVNRKNDIWLIKFDTAGTEVWNQYYGGTNDEQANSIIETSDSSIVFAGYTQSAGGDIWGHIGGNDFWVVKINALGDTLWTKCLGGSTDDIATSVQETFDHGFIIGGYTNSNNNDVSGNNGDYDGWIVKLNPDGDTLWTKCLGGTLADYINTIQITADSGYIVAGSTNSNIGDIILNKGGSDAWVIKLDKNGEVEWQKNYGGGTDDEIQGIQVLSTNEFAATSNSSYWIAKLNTTGDTIWTKTVSSGYADEVCGIAALDDRNFVLAGTGGSLKKYYIVKVKESCIFTTNVDISICEGEQIFLQGANRNISGNYYDTLTTSTGCDSIIVTSLTVIPSSSSSIEAAICEGESYMFSGIELSIQGFYYDTLVNAAGCDSIVTLHLTINTNSKTTTDKTICQGERYFAGGADQNTSGIYTDTYKNVNGCDSIVTTNLTVTNCTGITPQVTKNIKVFPNPTSGIINIQYDDFFKIELYDLAGNLILISDSKILDFSSFKTGLYMLKVICKNGYIQFVKVEYLK